MQLGELKFQVPILFTINKQEFLEIPLEQTASFAHLYHWSLSIPPENMGKSKVLWWFQGVSKQFVEKTTSIVGTYK